MTIAAYIGIGIFWEMMNVMAADAKGAKTGLKFLILLLHGALWPLSIIIYLIAFLLP